MYKVSRFNLEKIINGEKMIYNSATKAFMKVRHDISVNDLLELISNKDNQDTDIQALYSNGFIVETECDEISRLKYVYNKKYFDSSDLNIILVPTLSCNFSCPYCFEAPYRQADQNPQYFEVLKKYAEKYFRYYKHVELSLFGGEPLLVVNDIMGFLEFTSELSATHRFDYSCSIITNGSLLNRTIMDQLIKHKCQMMQITIDGGIRTHDNYRKFHDGTPSFDLLINIINEVVGPYLIKNDFSFILRFNLNNNEPAEIIDSLKLVNECYRKKISVFFRAVYNTETYNKINHNTSSDYDELMKCAKHLGYSIMYNQYYCRSCEACGDDNFFYICPDLSIWKCINILSDDSKAKFGQINADGEMAINADNISNWYKAADCFSDPMCVACPLLPDCLGGCIYYKVNTNERLCSQFNLTSLPFYYE